MELGNKIKELRTISKMSQEELGRRVGVQRAAINKYEKGTVSNIPVQTIEKIAMVFDVSPTYLLGWDESAENPLATEVKIIQGIKAFYGEEAVEILEAYSTINSKGKKKLHTYANDLSMLYEIGDMYNQLN